MTASYAADDRLLAELRAAWPPGEPAEPVGAAAGRGHAAIDLAGRMPAVALRLGDRFAVALFAQVDSSFLVVPLTRDEVLVTSWHVAVPGDGLSAFVAGVPMASERAIEGDQTNASVVVGERVIVKWFLRVGPGPSRAAVLLAHLEERGFGEIPAPLGSLTWRSPAGVELVLAQGDTFLPGARDGWDWCIERLERHVAHDELPHADTGRGLGGRPPSGGECPPGCDPWIGGPLGRLVARLHAALGTPSAVIPAPIGAATPADAERWRATAARTLVDALALTAAQDAEAGATLAAIEPQLRSAVESPPRDRPIPIQPIHGDLHVGQVLEWDGGFAVIDFDGNPSLGDDANPISQPPERDVAQMLTSLDHVGRVVDERTAGHRRTTIDAWIARTRRELLASLDADATLLPAFEVEQECRELVYAARFLPRWRSAPLAALRARFV